MPDCFPQGGCSPDTELVIPVNPPVRGLPEPPGFFGDLPATGQDIILLLLIAVAAIMVGYILILLARRRG